MSAMKMHTNEADIDSDLVRLLLVRQFPQWSALPVKPVACAGTDNALYRLGEDMVVRMPRIHGATRQVELEQLWLPRLAPLLPLAIPVPMAKGQPGEGYPWHWSVYRWLEGERTTIEQTRNPRESAVALASFIASLQRVGVDDWPQRPPVSARAEPLSARDAAVREAMASLRGVIDVVRATEAWDAALATPEWTGTPVWVHADLHSANLLSTRGRISADLDFGCVGLGDPACDVMAAWLFLSSSTRDVFRGTLQVDDATWARARGWALSVGLIALPYYRRSNAEFAVIARRAIEEAASDHGG